MKTHIAILSAFSAFALSSPLLLLTSCEKKAASGEATTATTTQGTKINDPSGYYNLFSDPGVTSHPPEGFVVGKGKTVEIKYDGSQGGDILSYQLSYVDNNGSVHPMGGGSFETKGDGLFSQEIIVFNSSAHNRPGFLEVTTVVGAGMQDGKVNYGKNIKLGMYPVKFEASE